MHVTAIIAAAGRGQRLGAAQPKQFLDIAGRSLLERSLYALMASERIDDVIVALPRETLDSPPSYLLQTSKPVRLIGGGARRQDSVAHAFAALDPRTTLVVVHDAARPFVSAAVIARTIDAAQASGAAIAAVAISDTVKQSSAPDASGARIIERTLSRDRLYLAQTPQAFRRDLLARALAEGADALDATDEAMLAERLGFRVQLVEGDVANVKVTSAEDLEQAKAKLRDSGSAAMRVGTGYDLHRLIAGRPLILAGVRIPFEMGLDGHSDADIVCHAVTDAVLGAAAQGDIGRLFPDSDERWKNADSLELLSMAVDQIRRAGWMVSNVDVTVVAQRPKLLPHVDAMRVGLAARLGCDAEVVSIKGKTNEGVDSIGRGESMACHAVALLRRI
ncbi:MAG: 2-C-methyl-D-erythritol 4-phosphate cytidylyltransferase [Acidobacteria bacterium]|nr:2-C-methyl-D-erythritol 4-phosphate cytidylyltransferase [Acidobacteriota bacterium]